MQITIDTQAEPLLPIIRMLQALHEAQTRKLRITNAPIDITDDDSLEAILTGVVKPDLTRTYTGCFNVEDYTQGSDIQGPATVLRAGKQIATFPEGLYRDVFFDEPDHKIEIPGTSADQIYTGAALQAAVPPPCSAHAQEDDEPAPKSLFDAPLPPCDQTEKVGEAISDVTVDAAGLPWDERIHSGAKSKLANGNWKLRRGVDPAQVASVEAELRGDPKPAEAATGPSPAPVPPAPPVAPPTTAAVVAPPVSPPAPKPITNAAELVAAVMDKRFTTDQVNAACQAVGVENVASLLAKQDKLPEVLRELGL